jgi:hypothetical protein
MCFAGTSQITVLGGGIESIFELPLNICFNLSTFAFYIELRYAAAAHAPQFSQ